MRMSLLILLAATVSPMSASSATAQDITAQRPTQRSKARVVGRASATIVRLEKVSPLAKKTAPSNKVQRPIAKQRIVKSGVPYVEFY